MTKDFTIRNTEEATTHQLFTEYLNENWTSHGAMIGQVFKAMWSSALPADKVNAVASAMHGFQNLDVQPTLTKLVRAKVLRSYSKNGKRYYEVNY